MIGDIMLVRVIRREKRGRKRRLAGLRVIIPHLGRRMSQVDRGRELPGGVKAGVKMVVFISRAGRCVVSLSRC
jgi:hypothetical protein